MTTPWIIGFICLVGTVAVLATIMVGLLRRITDVLLKVEAALISPLPVGGNPASGELRVGDTVPPLPLQSGENFPNTRGTLLVFLEASCEPCQVLAADINRRRYKPPDFRLVVVVDDDDSLGHEWPVEWTVVVDRDRMLSKSWRVWGTPAAYLVDYDGTVRGRKFANSANDLQRLIDVEGDALCHPKAQELFRATTR